MKNIDGFCELKGVSPNMEEAFIAYLRSDYARRYSIANGETAKLIVSKMNEEEIESAWNNFVVEFKEYLMS